MLARKLHVKSGTVVAMLGRPAGVEIALPEGARESAKGPADVVVVFAKASGDVRRGLAEAGRSLAAGGVLWVAYPKAGQLGTDLSRDVLARALQAEGLEPVAQIAVDGVWSALRVKRDAALSDARRARGASIGVPKKKKAAAAPKKKATAKKKAAAAPKKKAATKRKARS